MSGIFRIAPTNCRYSVAVRKLGGVSCSGMIPTRSRTPMGSCRTSRPSTVAYLAGWPDLAGEHLDHRRFSGSVRAQEAKKSAFPDREADTIDCDEVTVHFGEAGGLQLRGWSWPASRGTGEGICSQYRGPGLIPRVVKGEIVQCRSWVVHQWGGGCRVTGLSPVCGRKGRIVTSVMVARASFSLPSCRPRCRVHRASGWAARPFQRNASPCRVRSARCSGSGVAMIRGARTEREEARIEQRRPGS